MKDQRPKTNRPSQRRRRDQLIGRYDSYVKRMVKTLMRTMHLPSRIYDELIAAGYLGLVEAAERFDTDRGGEFSTFAYLRIRGAIIDTIRASSELTGKAYHSAKALVAAHSLRAVNLEEGDQLCGNRATAVATLLDYVAQSSLVFRLSLVEAQNELSSIADPAPNPEEKIVNRQDDDLFRSIVASLPEKERFVIEQYYYNDRTFAEIAEMQDSFSKSWVSRLHARAIELIKLRYEKNKF